MYEFLLAQHGPTCQGYNRPFDDPRYLQLDPQHAARRRRAESRLEPRAALRPVQSGQEQHIHAVRIAKTEQEERMDIHRHSEK